MRLLNNSLLSVRFTTTLLLVVILLFLFNVNPDVFKVGAQAVPPVPVFGEGQPGFLPKWLGFVASEPVASSVIAPGAVDYCFGPAAIVTWSYFDPAGSAQSAYQVQIDDDIVFFGSPEWDSGKVFNSGTSNSASSCNPNNPVGTGPGTCRLDFNKTYMARVKVWNSSDVSSLLWGQSSTWQTPLHALPFPDFTFFPPIPAVGSPVTFTDATIFAPGSISRTWSWDFGGGAPGTATGQGPHNNTYSANGIFNPILTVSDNAGTCSITKPVSIQKALPQWREVLPR